MFCIACLVLRFEIHEGAKDQCSSFREKTEVRKCTVKCCQSLGNLAASRLEGVWWYVLRVLPHITLGLTAVLKSEKKRYFSNFY